MAYGKFFDKKAGFISIDWPPYFVNSRRSGYDFDSRWEDGHATRREKKIMDFFIGQDEDGNNVFKDIRILSTDLKKQAGFGKGGEKNYPGVITQLQMETYLVISDFHRRENKRGEEYGMPVSILAMNVNHLAAIHFLQYMISIFSRFNWQKYLPEKISSGCRIRMASC